MNLVAFDNSFLELSLDWHKNKEIANSIGLWNEYYSDLDLVTMVRNWVEDKTIRIFGIKDKDEKKVGYIMLKNIDTKNKTAETHITMGVPSNMTSYLAYKKIIQYAFNVLQLENIYTYCIEGCQKTIALMNRKPFGFINRGLQKDLIVKKDGRISAYVYSLNKNDFQKG